MQDFQLEHRPSSDITDNIYTPENIAIKIINHFSPAGKVLDPCRGDGAFFNNLEGADYCEIAEGIDFFTINNKYDWIISNPPYSDYSEWLRHSFRLADNIVYLIPINKVFNSSKMLLELQDWGGVPEILHIAPGSRLNFPIGFAIGAVHYQKNYKGKTDINNAYFMRKINHEDPPLNDKSD